MPKAILMLNITISPQAKLADPGRAMFKQKTVNVNKRFHLLEGEHGVSVIQEVISHTIAQYTAHRPVHGG